MYIHYKLIDMHSYIKIPKLLCVMASLHVNGTKKGRFENLQIVMRIKTRKPLSAIAVLMTIKSIQIYCQTLWDFSIGGSGRIYPWQDICHHVHSVAVHWLIYHDICHHVHPVAVHWEIYHDITSFQSCHVNFMHQK